MKHYILILLLCTITRTILLASPPAEADRLLAASQAALKAKDAKAAVELAEQAVAADPARADLQAHLGSAYSVRIGEVNFMHQAIISHKMLAAFERAVELDPDHIGGRIGLSRYYTHAPAIAGGSRAKAEAEAQRLKQRHPFLGTLEHGLIAEHFGDFAKAREAFAEAAKLQPDNPHVHERLGAVAEKAGDPATARRHYEQALRLEPSRNEAEQALKRLAEAAE
ncbi:MAG TPA: tetratricopeptide repeat protein [Candidatus Synoicihabitans sp.]|nr:tetratricopeptide repeat protein [Candidatus Synoicihabitans sp.]